jgi:hypothetical protein
MALFPASDAVFLDVHCSRPVKAALDRPVGTHGLGEEFGTEADAGASGPTWPPGVFRDDGGPRNGMMLPGALGPGPCCRDQR